MRTLPVIVAVGLALISCGVKEKPDAISGIYVREYSFEIINAESGNKIGMRAVRDSIFIRPMDDGYEISNRKWRKNDYDLEGWQNMEHSEDRPVPARRATYDAKNRVLITDSEQTIHLNQIEGFLYVGTQRKNYIKVRE